MHKATFIISFVFLLLWAVTRIAFPDWYSGTYALALELAIIGICFALLFYYKRRSARTEPKADLQYDLFFQENPTPMWIAETGSLRFLAVNKATLKAYGYTEPEFLSMSAKDIRPPETVGDFLNFIGSSVKDDRPNLGKGIFLHQGKTGNPFYVKVFGYPTVYQEKTARLIVAVSVDLEIRNEELQSQLTKQFQTRLRYHESLLANQCNYFVLRFSLDGNYTYVNPALLRRLGLPETAILGKSAFEGILEEDAAGAGMAVQQCMENVGQAFFARIRRPMPDGSIAVGDYEMVAIPDADGVVTEIQCMGFEITEALRQMDELNAYKTRLERILSSITDGFYVLDTEWRFTYVNNEMAQNLEHTPEELIGQSLWLYMPEEVVNAYKAKFREAIDRQTSVHFEAYIDQYQIWHSIVAYPTSEGLSVFWRDITSYKRSEEQVRKRGVMLQEIAWVQSHKVRAPLARILGLVQIFNRQDYADPENSEVISLLKIASDDLDHVIHEVVNKVYDDVNAAAVVEAEID